MMIKLLPEQIAEYWNVISFALEESLPPLANETINKMNRLLESLLNGSMQCWILYDEGETRKLNAVIVTSIMSDYCSDINNLLIYALYGFQDLSEESWMDGYETLSKWGKSVGCSRIIAYTDIDRVKDMVKVLGGEAKYTFISLPLCNKMVHREG